MFGHNLIMTEPLTGVGRYGYCLEGRIMQILYSLTNEKSIKPFSPQRPSTINLCAEGRGRDGGSRVSSLIHFDLRV